MKNIIINWITKKLIKDRVEDFKKLLFTQDVSPKVILFKLHYLANISNNKDIALWLEKEMSSKVHHDDDKNCFRNNVKATKIHSYIDTDYRDPARKDKSRVYIYCDVSIVWVFDYLIQNREQKKPALILRQTSGDCEDYCCYETKVAYNELESMYMRFVLECSQYLKVIESQNIIFFNILKVLNFFYKKRA